MFESERTDGESARTEHEDFLEILGELVNGPNSRAPERGAAGDRAAGEIAMASELLEVQTEAELEQFLGAVQRRAVGAAGRRGAGGGRALRRALRQAARRALPAIGRAGGAPEANGYGDPDEQQDRPAGSLFGLELEGLSREDREFEVARAFVRFADAASHEAATAPGFLSAADVAKSAATSAAQQHMPGLLASRPGGVQPPEGGGRWVRHRNQIVVHGA